MLRFPLARRRRILPLILGFVCLTSGAVFLPSLFATSELFAAMIGWSIPLPFIAAGIMFYMRRHMDDDDRRLTTSYFGLWAVVGLSLIPLTIVMMVWILDIDHDYLVGSATCTTPAMERAGECSLTSRLVNNTNSALMPIAIPMVGWFIPSLFYVILGFSRRNFG